MAVRSGERCARKGRGRARWLRLRSELGAMRQISSLRAVVEGAEGDERMLGTPGCLKGYAAKAVREERFREVGGGALRLAREGR